jgi:outer membrane protein assembly factor BamD (BamD/ComL family)
MADSIPVEFKVKTNLSQNNCHITITKSPKLMAVEFYTKATEQFNNDNISDAIESLESTICLDPNHTQAQEMLEMLKDI